MQGLEEEQQQQLAEEARKEYDAEKSTSEDAPSTENAEPESPKAEKPKEQQPAKAQGDEEDVNDDEKPAEDAPPEEKPKEGEPEAEKPKEEPKSELDDQVIQDWALKHGMTVDEAKEDLEKTKAVAGKYKSPEEMARALRLIQSQADKYRHELQQKAEAKEQEIPQGVNPKLEVMQHIEANKAEIIEKYRQNYPARTRDMEDDAILEEVQEKLYSGYVAWKVEQSKAVKQQAAQKREEIYSSLSADDRNFLADIKAVVDKTDDRSIISKNFNLTDVVRWAKGGRYDKAIKEAEERGYKRAIEEKRIVAVMPNGSKQPAQKAKSTVSLSDYDKQRAREMYGTTTMTEDEMFEEYSKTVKSRKTK